MGWINSGVFVRFPPPTADLATEVLKHRAAHEPPFDPGNPAWKPVIAGFEVQIDDNAIGDGTKDFTASGQNPMGYTKIARAGRPL
jgi:hypothetical protein